jgi:hypothetical protein
MSNLVLPIATSMLYWLAIIGGYTVIAFIYDQKNINPILLVLVKVVAYLLALTVLFLVPAYIYGQVKSSISDLQFVLFLVVLLPGAAIFYLVAKSLPGRA